MADGSLNFDTRIDLSGFMKGANTVKGQTENLKNTIQIAGDHIRKAFKIDSSSFSSQAKSIKGDIDGIGKEADETGQKIAQILSNEEKSAKSKASSIAAIYREQGMNQSDAMKKAWEHIERSAGEFNKKIEKSAKESSGKVRDYYEKSCSGVSAMFKKLGVVVAGFFAGRKLLETGKEAIGFASDIQEVQNVVDTAFGDMAYKMEEFADTAIETYGISKLSAKQTGSTYMAMAKGMGIATDAASDMALSLTGLSADMASFYNVSQDVASTALKSVFTGETETLKQYGIVMTETNLQEYALSQGIKKKLSAMNQAEKVQLRYNYVMQQTALAQGDFAKTSDSWANQTRILSERWKEFLGIIGSGLIKVLTPAIQFLNTAMSQLIAFANTTGKVISQVFGLKQSTDGVSKSAASMGIGAEEAGAGIGEMADEAAAANKKINGSLAGFDKLNVITQKTADNAGAAVGGIGASGGVEVGNISVGGIEKDNVSPMVDQITEKLENFKNYLRTNFAPVFSEVTSKIQPSIAEFRENVLGMFSDIQTLGQPLLDYFSGDFTPALQTAFLTLGVIAAGFFDSFNMVFSDIWNLAIFPFLTTLLAIGLPVITEFGAEAFKTVSVLFTEIKVLFDKLWTEWAAPVLKLLTGIWQDCWTSIKEFWDKWGAPIFENIRETITKLGEYWQSVWDNYLGPIWETFMEVVNKLWDEHLKPLLDNFLDLVGEFVNGALEIYNKFIQPMAKWFVEKLGPPVSKVISFLIRTIGNFLAGTIDATNGIVTAWRGLIQFLTGVFTGDWRKAWTGVKNIFKGVFDSLVSIAKRPINLIIDIINGMISGVVAGVNAVIRAINKISFTVPDWIPEFGGETIGFNLSECTVPKIPRLATGAVIPPNSEFLAILGDQKHGTNIEAPLSTITEAVVDALREIMPEMRGTGKQEVVFRVEGDPHGIFKIVRQEANDFMDRTGVIPFPI